MKLFLKERSGTYTYMEGQKIIDSKRFWKETKLISIKTKVYVQKVGLTPTWRPKRLMDMYKRNGTYTLRVAHDQFELEFKRFERKTLILICIFKE